MNRACCSVSCASVIVFLTGCAPAIQRAYDGPDRPDREVAIVFSATPCNLPCASYFGIDKPRTQFSDVFARVVKIAPGFHRVRVHCSAVDYAWGYPTRTIRASAVLEVEGTFEAGHYYQLVCGERDAIAYASYVDRTADYRLDAGREPVRVAVAPGSTAPPAVSPLHRVQAFYKAIEAVAGKSSREFSGICREYSTSPGLDLVALSRPGQNSFRFEGGAIVETKLSIEDQLERLPPFAGVRHYLLSGELKFSKLAYRLVSENPDAASIRVTGLMDLSGAMLPVNKSSQVPQPVDVTLMLAKAVETVEWTSDAKPVVKTGSKWLISAGAPGCN